jgi:hypothetical protein
MGSIAIVIHRLCTYILKLYWGYVKVYLGYVGLIFKYGDYT